MAKHLILKKDEILWWSWYLSGLWFQRRNNSNQKKEVDTSIIEINEVEKKIENKNNVFSNFKLATKTSINNDIPSSKKQKKHTNKKNMRYIDMNVNPQRLKPRWYNGYDVSNRATDEDDQKEIQKYKYEK